jgi:hypothetical protein
MENIRIFIDELDQSEHIIIEHKDGSSTSMLKSTYDAQQAALETPMVIDEAPAE